MGTPWGAHPILHAGNRYYYMPWHDSKPVVAVTSTWEDAGQRWDGQNLLHSVGERLVSSQGWGEAWGWGHGDMGHRGWGHRDVGMQGHGDKWVWGHGAMGHKGWGHG